MTYILITLGLILLVLGLGMIFSEPARLGVLGGLLTIAGAILMAGGSISDRMDRRM
jgi:uncharacterized membrane protein